MYILLAYDVGTKRLPKMLKTVRQYLTPVQLSLFEGHLTEKELSDLRGLLEQIMDMDEDKLFIFATENMRFTKIHKVGNMGEKGSNFI